MSREQVRPSCPDCGRWLTRRGECRDPKCGVPARPKVKP